MGLIVRVYKCDDCGLEVDQLQERDDFTPPECPACVAETEMSGPIPATTAVGERRATKSVDGMWKAMQEGSEIRAEALGDPSMKITDMKDGFYGGLRQGDSTAPTPQINNTVTQFASATNFNHWAQGGGSGTTVTPEMAASVARQSRGGSKIGSGMAQLNAITGGGPMQFPARQRPK